MFEDHVAAVLVLLKLFRGPEEQDPGRGLLMLRSEEKRNCVVVTGASSSHRYLSVLETTMQTFCICVFGRRRSRRLRLGKEGVNRLKQITNPAPIHPSRIPCSNCINLCRKISNKCLPIVFTSGLLMIYL